MPQLKLSDRDLETVPLVHRRMGAGFDTAIRARRDAAVASAEAMGRVPYQVEHGIHELERMKRTLDVRLDRDAEEVVTQWEAAMMAGLNGSAAPDGTRIPGIASKTWADYEGTGGSPITDLAEIEKNFRASEAYKGMSSLVRKRFDRKVAVSRQRYLDAANRLYDRNRIARDAFHEQQSDLMHERKVETNLFSSDADFEAVSREEAFRKMGRKYANLGLIANPEVIDAPGAGPADIKWKDKKAELFFNGAYLDQLQKWGKGRCIALANNAALGEVKIVDGKVVSNEAQLKAAEAYAAKLAQPQKLADGTVLPARISPAEAQEIGFKLVQARAALDQRIRGELTGLGAAAIAQGDLASLEKAHADLQTAASGFAKGSKNHTSALEEANKVDTAADIEAVRIVKNDLLSGHAVTMSDGKTPIYDPGSRLAKAYTVAVAEAAKDKAKSAATLDDDIRYQELELDYAIESGMASKDDIAKKKREIVDRVDALSAGRLMKPEDVAEFRKRWTNRNASDESAAAVDFDRAFGLSLEDFTDAKGAISTDVSNANYKKTIRSGQKAMFPGTDEKVSLGEYLKMRASFLERLRALPANADRRQETAKLLDEFKGGWYARQTEANIEALSRTMNDIHIGIESEVEAERLKAAAEEEKRNMPVVDRRHPANADPNPDPLEFYRQANPLDPTLNFR